MHDRLYRVRALVSDGRPGLIPFVFEVPAKDHDEAKKIVRQHIRWRGKVVKHIDFVRLAMRDKRSPYNQGQVH